MNPNNPLGDVFTKQEVLDVLHFCHRYIKFSTFFQNKHLLVLFDV